MPDSRYSTIRGLLKEGQIKKFTDIFKWIPHTVVAADFRTMNTRMKKMTQDASLWKLSELYKLAGLIGYDPKKLALMAVEEVEERMNPTPPAP